MTSITIKKLYVIIALALALSTFSVGTKSDSSLVPKKEGRVAVIAAGSPPAQPPWKPLTKLAPSDPPDPKTGCETQRSMTAWGEEQAGVVPPDDDDEGRPHGSVRPVPGAGGGGG